MHGLDYISRVKKLYGSTISEMEHRAMYLRLKFHTICCLYALPDPRRRYLSISKTDIFFS
jgi:hypothetical protein